MIRRSFLGLLAWLLPTSLFGENQKENTSSPRPKELLMKVGTAKLIMPTKCQLRLWRLGSLEHNMIPSQKAIDKLVGILAEWDRKSDLDLVWGPELDVLTVNVPTGEDGIDVVDDMKTIKVFLPHGETRQIEVIQRPKVTKEIQ